MQTQPYSANVKHDSASWSAAKAGPPRRMVKADRKKRGDPPDLSVDQVLAWADAFFERAGVWPDWQSGPIDEAPGETWFTVAAALALGRRGLPGGESLRDFIDRERGGISRAVLEFSERQILAWALAWQTRVGRRPRKNSGQIPDSGGLTWSIVNDALKKGIGILAGGSSLARFLRSKRAELRGPAVTEKQILVWADAYYKRTGTYPSAGSGAIPEAPAENWRLLDRALEDGTRSLPGGSSLRQLLVAARGPEARRRSRKRCRLTIGEVRAWAQAHRQRTGRWPTDQSGRIPETERETWRAVDCAMRRGGRGLPGGTSLSLIFGELSPAPRIQCAGGEESLGLPGPNSSG